MGFNSGFKGLSSQSMDFVVMITAANVPQH